MSAYSGERGTYTCLNRGAIQLVTLTIDGDQINGTIENDKLTINNDGDTFVMTRMSATRFFCLEDDEEMMVELLPDGTMTVMEGLSERANGSITFEAGKRLVWTITHDGETRQTGFVIEDKALRLLGYDGDEEIILNEDAAVMKNFDAAMKTMYPELGEWMLVGAEGEGAEEALAEMKAANRTSMVTFDGDKMVIAVAENDVAVDEDVFYYYFTGEGQLNIYNYDDYYTHIDEYLDCEINGDTMKLTQDGLILIFQRK